jgi:hypothetical protein
LVSVAVAHQLVDVLYVLVAVLPEYLLHCDVMAFWLIIRIVVVVAVAIATEIEIKVAIVMAMGLGGRGASGKSGNGGESDNELFHDGILWVKWVGVGTFDVLVLGELR